MATWAEFEQEAPALAAMVRRRFEASRHHVLATLRRDGSPRVSGTEVDFSGSDIGIGSMAGARKALDLLRDGRFAVHAAPAPLTDIGSMVDGDAKIAGVAVPTAPRPDGSHTFRLDLQDVVSTSVHPDGDRLVVEVWQPGRGVRRIERR